jgi:dolichyl-phosphate-mannose--protein O-mannosyl transferase
MKVDSAPCKRHHEIALAIITTLAFLTRFCGLAHPSEIVFDEAHTMRVNSNHAILPF